MAAPVFLPPGPIKRRKKRRSALLSVLGYMFGLGVLLFLVGSAGAGFLLWKASRDLPDYDSLSRYEPPVMTRIHAHDGSLMAEYAKERRIFVPITNVPKLVIAAYLSAEDRRFYEHGGVDFLGIARAGFKFVESKLKGSARRTEGASTITQQVAKNFLLTSERTLDRKLMEAILAIRIEKAYSKDKILELYLNEINLGLAYGIGGAALTYFGKELSQLDIEEAAYLAVLPKAPNNYHPFRHKERATVRRNWIIGQMAENGYITQQQAEAAKAKDLKVNLRSLGTQIYAADYFAEEVRRSLVGQYGEDGLYGKLDRTGAGDGKVNGGLSVRTTLDPRLQKFARRALIDGLVQFDRDKGWRGAVQKIDIAGDWGVPLGQIDVPSDMFPWRLGVVYEIARTHVNVGLRPLKQPDGKLVADREAVRIDYDDLKWANKKPSKAASPADFLAVGDVVWVAPRDPDKINEKWALMQVPEVAGGLIAMDPHTGRVHAVVGGFSFAASQFDRALQAKRQPGSSFKPLVYAAALDNGYKPTSIVMDAPFCKEATATQPEWCPKNYEGDKSYGPQTLRHGIEKSRNQMTVRLAEDMGMPLIAEYSKRFGVYDDMLPVLSMSLGAGETTLLRMATAYSTFANGGKQVHATLIDRIQDRWGKTIWRHDDRECAKCKTAALADEPDLTDDRRQIIDPHTAYQMTSIMEGVVQRGTGTRVRELLPNHPVAGKTGTSNEEKDAWFVGYTADLVVGVFIGYDTPKPMGKGRTGGQFAAPIVGNFLKNALADKKPVPFRSPPGIKEVRVNLKTGIRSGPEDREAIREYFKPYEEPDDVHSVIGVTADGGSVFAPLEPSQPQRQLQSGRPLY
jgi:penicillin-binding protein 1A